MADSRATEANRILALILQHIVDDPTAVQVEMRHSTKTTKFLIRADQRSTALLIGHQGRMARSIRAILEAVGNQDSWHYHLTIEESPLDQYLSDLNVPGQTPLFASYSLQSEQERRIPRLAELSPIALPVRRF